MIEFGKWFSDGCSSMLSGFDGIISSPVSVSLVISAVMLLIVVMIYPARRGSSGSILLRILLYNFVVTLVVLLVHDMSIKKCMRGDDYSSVLDGRNALSTHVSVHDHASTTHTVGASEPMPSPPTAPSSPTATMMPVQDDDISPPSG